MPTIGIRIVSQGNNSDWGHMYVVFKDDNGNVSVFGLYREGVSDRLDLLLHESRVGMSGASGAPNYSRDFVVSNEKG